MIDDRSIAYKKAQLGILEKQVENQLAVVDEITDEYKKIVHELRVEHDKMVDLEIKLLKAILEVREYSRGEKHND